MKQPAQKKDSYSGNANRAPVVNGKPTTQFDKEFNENLDVQSNKDDKDYEDENEDDIDEDEENEDEEESLSQKHNFRNKNHSNKNYQTKPLNQRNQFRGANQIHGRNHQMKFNQNQNNQRYRNKPAPDDDEEEITQYTKERANRKNQHEYDFTRRNVSRNRVQRAAWQLENSIFESELSKISFVDQCPYRLQLVRHNLQGNFNFRYSQMPASTNSRHGETFIQVPNTNVNHQLGDQRMKLSLVQFEIVPLLDVGGGLEVELGLNIDFDTTVNNVSVIACVKHNRIATSLNNCLNKLQVNSSNLSQNKISTTFIPYPKSGQVSSLTI